MTDFEHIRYTNAINRALVIGVGHFGIRALAHIYARMRFEDLQRSLKHPGLPRLQNTVKYDLILPDGSGFVAGPPNPNEGWNEDIFIRQILRLEESITQKSLDRQTEYLSTINPTLIESQMCKVVGGQSHPNREACFKNAVDHSIELGDHLVQLADQARIDRDAPGIENSRFIICILAALSEPEASALLWPLLLAIRESLGGYLPIEVIGILNVGAFGDQQQRHRQGAHLHAALRELAYFSNRAESAGSAILKGKAGQCKDSSNFDRCYLLDSEKQNRSRPAGENEIILAAGNMMETLLLSDALSEIDISTGPDEDTIKTHGPFSTFGASSVYIPIDRWRVLDRDQYLYDILIQCYLTPLPETTNRIREEVDRHSNLVSLDYLTRQLVRDNCPPFHVLEFGRGQRQERGAIGRMMRLAGQERPLTNQGKIIPLPQIRVDLNALETRIDFTELDQFGERRRRVPPERWLGYLYRRFCEIGVDDSLIFPDEPSIEAYRTDFSTMAEEQPETLFDRWNQAMIRTCDTSLLPDASQISEDIPDLPMMVEQAGGIVPEIWRMLHDHFSKIIATDNQGLVVSLGVIQELRERLTTSREMLTDYRIRLARAADSGSVRRERAEADARGRLRFNRLLAQRPPIPGLITRGIALAALLSTIINFLSQLLVPNLLGDQSAAMSVIAGVAAAILSGFLLRFIYFRRLRSTAQSLINNLVSVINQEVNHNIAKSLLVKNMETAENGPDSQLGGLIPQVDDLLQVFESVLQESLKELVSFAEDLKMNISDPFSLTEKYLRYPISKTEEVRALIEGEGQSGPDEKKEEKVSFPDSFLDHENPQALQMVKSIFGSCLESETGFQIDEDAQVATAAETFPSYPDISGIMESLSTEQDYQHRYRSVGDLIGETIRNYTNKIVKLPEPPVNLSIESLLHSQNTSLKTFLFELIGRAQPLLNWEEENLDKNLPIITRLISLEIPADSAGLSAIAQDQRISTLTSLDPFAVTFMCTYDGINLKDIPHFKIYAEDFLRFPNDRINMVIASNNNALTKAGKYLKDSSSQ
jgi:hypothetical protein